MITFMAKMFGFRNAIVNALHCKIHLPNNIKSCSLPFVKLWTFMSVYYLKSIY